MKVRSKDEGAGPAAFAESKTQKNPGGEWRAKLRILRRATGGCSSQDKEHQAPRLKQGSLLLGDS